MNNNRKRVHQLDHDNPDVVLFGLTWRGIVLLIVGVLVLGGLGAGIWAFKVATSGVKGTGDTVRQNQDASNRIAQQRAFVNMYEGIKANDQKIQVLADSAARNPGDPKAQADYQGTQLVCLGQVADYNAKVQETLAADWLPETLPSTVGADPSTDCKPDVTPAASPR